MSKYLAEQISEVVVNTHFEDLPQYAVDKAKMLTLDVLASMVGTRKVISSEIARDVAAELGGPEEASIVGYGKKVAAPNAAFANAIQCYGLDFVDDHNESNAHPSPVTYPVSFALAEQLKRSGKEFIEACVLGNEIVCRMGSAYLGDMYTQGFHPTSTCGTMGGVVSAAKLMKLDEQKVSYAQGIAGSAVAGLMAWNTQGSFTKRYQAGRPSMDVIVAARMAEKGFNGPTDIFESQDGLLHAYSYQDRYDTNWITKDLGKEWIFATSSIKVYPCCRYSGGHLDACLEIVHKYHPDPAKIAKIHVRSSLQTMHLLAEPRKWHPENIVDLQFSMPYQAAVAFLNGKFTPDELNVEYIKNPLIQKMIANTTVVCDDEFERRYPEHYSSAVTITMEDGTEYTAVVDDPKGDWRNPVTYEDVENKFRYLANTVYAEPERTEKIIAFVKDLEKQPDMRVLMELVNDEAK